MSAPDRAANQVHNAIEAAQALRDAVDAVLGSSAVSVRPEGGSGATTAPSGSSSEGRGGQ